MFGDAAWLDTVGRILIAASFLVSGLFNVAQARDHIARMAGLHVPLPAFAFWRHFAFYPQKVGRIETLPA